MRWRGRSRWLKLGKVGEGWKGGDGGEERTWDEGVEVGGSR